MTTQDYASRPRRGNKPRTSDLPPRRPKEPPLRAERRGAAPVKPPRKPAEKKPSTKKSAATKRPAKPTPLWMGLVLGALAFISGLLYLNRTPGDTPPASVDVPPPATPAPVAREDAPPTKTPAVAITPPSAKSSDRQQVAVQPAPRGAPSAPKPKNSEPAATDVPTPLATAEAPKVAPKPPAEPPAPQFRFYELLPEVTVQPSNIDIYDPGPDKPSTRVQYMLQAGSFRAEADAERQRAQIAFLGLKAQTEKVSLSADNIWYRVHVGPYSTRSEMNSAIDKLVSIQIRPLTRTVPIKR